jgi:hypothetical protein
MTETAVTADPFAAGATEDPFGDPTAGGGFPKLEDLEDFLVLIRPKAVTLVADRFHKPAAGETQRMKKRATTDLTVFRADGTHSTYRNMYISQVGLVGELERVLEEANPNRPFVLGVVGMLPNKSAKDSGITTREALKDAIAAWVKKGGKGDKPGYFWGLDAASDAQKAVARPVAMAMLNKANPFA